MVAVAERQLCLSKSHLCPIQFSARPCILSPFPSMSLLVSLVFCWPFHITLIHLFSEFLILHTFFITITVYTVLHFNTPVMSSVTPQPSLHLLFINRYIFKGEEDLPYLPLHRQSAYLIGRDRKVADIPTDHPSCSKQHAVLQYRLVTYTRGDGTKSKWGSPYGTQSEWGLIGVSLSPTPHCTVPSQDIEDLSFWLG